MNPEKTLPLLFEIGCEEIPARFLEKAQRDLGSALSESLRNARLLPRDDVNGAIQTYSTPRRLVAYAGVILQKQPERTVELLGPPVKAAYDQKGKPSRAATSFAEKHNVTLDELARTTTPKGEYLVVRKVEPGLPARDVLFEILPGVIQSVAFQKSMVWIAKTGPRFVRPIRWILALLGDGDAVEIIPFSFAAVQAGGVTYGHRLKGGKPLRVSSLKDYLKKLRRNWVEADSDRRRLFAAAADELLKAQDAIRVDDKDLETWVVNSTEWPTPLAGGFDERYLKLPREVLVTVMRDHQKYFAVENKTGQLQPRFVTVLNVPGDPEGLIRQGHERVLTARFADAEFFWNADQNVSLSQRISMLERVTYQAKLGTYADKVKRMKSLAEKICEELEKSRAMNAAERQHALHAVELCKCDLTTQMVKEFTELQGIMGGLYAKAQGEVTEVADAIYDHYRPVNIEDSCPRSVVGAVVSLADKLDSLLAGFAVGVEPTGSSDPFALRRAGNGIIKIAAEKLPKLNLYALIALASSLNAYLTISQQSDLHGRIKKFLRERVESYLRDVVKLRYDTARAIVYSALASTNPADAKGRGLALEQIRDSEDYRSLSQAAKRTRNILTKSAHIDYAPGIENVRTDLFESREEHELHQAFEAMWTRLLDLEKQQEYEQAFRELARMRKPIDEFFDRVHVMTEKMEVQGNRLTMLNSINALIFSRLADLAQIESGEVNAGATKVEASNTG
ncbi:MAG: glycine--tRNA ligase subunit beta [Terriglobia bacterium]